MFETLLAPGWFGKLPTVGDFASRRLPQDVIDWWDSWLSLGLAQLRERHAGEWQALFLAAPAWRFVMAPGVAPGAPGRHAWAGVLIPSVDCVGRYFPLSLLAPLSHWPLAADEGVALGRWLERLEGLAGDALHDDWSIEQLEQVLDSDPQRLAPPDDTDADPAQESVQFPAEALASMGVAGRRLFAEHRAGRSLWQRGSSTDGAWQMIEGLPPAQALFEAWA
jgi:type VI secretion system protein ImpM